VVVAASLTAAAAPGRVGRLVPILKPPVTPSTDRAAIFNTFTFTGAYAQDGVLLERLKADLEGEGYQVTTYGLAGQPPATLGDFLSLARYSVVIFNTHGYDPTKPRHSCPEATKGLFPVRADGTPVSVPGPSEVCRDAPQPRVPSLLVQTFGTEDAVVEAFRSYADRGVDPSLMEAIAILDGEGGPVTGYGLLLTAPGVAHYFASSRIALVDGIACHSLSFASGFHALSYLGYVPNTCAVDDVPDTMLLFDRLTGREGVAARTTIAALGKGGFREHLELAPGAIPVVLSPAVGSVTPEDGATLAGSVTKVTVRFDARMEPRPAAGLVEASGCGARATGGSWTDNNSVLSFDLETRRTGGDDTVRLRIANGVAHAAGGSPDAANHALDGNQSPSPANGAAPNRTDYVWQLTCASEPPCVFLAGSVAECRSTNPDATLDFRMGANAYGCTFGISIDWGDESPAQRVLVRGGPPGPVFEAAHRYPKPGEYTITGTPTGVSGGCYVYGATFHFTLR